MNQNDPKKLAFDMGIALLGESKSTRSFIGKLAQHHKVTVSPANWWLVIHSIALAENAGDPRQFIGGILRNGTKIPVHAKVVEKGMRPATEDECKTFMLKYPWYGYVSREIPRWADRRK